MGTWGTGLYEDDIALDVRDEFKNLLRSGVTAEEATAELLVSFSGATDDNDDGPIFWFALADTQWDMVCLLPQVKKEALRRLDKGGDLARWQEEDSTLATARKKVLDELQQKLNSPSPLKKKARNSTK